MTAEQLEAAALQSVEAHQNQVLAAARAAFRRPPDPLRSFAEAVASSNVVQIRAMQQLNAAFNERFRRALSEIQVPADGRVQVVPAGNLLDLLGIYPADAARFRIWAICITMVVILATLGAGVVIGRSSVHDPAPAVTAPST